jgi:hypothetical protein
MKQKTDSGINPTKVSPVDQPDTSPNQFNANILPHANKINNRYGLPVDGTTWTTVHWDSPRCILQYNIQPQRKSLLPEAEEAACLEPGGYLRGPPRTTLPDQPMSYAHHQATSYNYCGHQLRITIEEHERLAWEGFQRKDETPADGWSLGNVKQTMLPACTSSKKGNWRWEATRRLVLKAKWTQKAAREDSEVICQLCDESLYSS